MYVIWHILHIHVYILCTMYMYMNYSQTFLYSIHVHVYAEVYGNPYNHYTKYYDTYGVGLTTVSFQTV